MASQPLSRKRPAPGNPPATYQPTYPQPPAPVNYSGFDSGISNDQFLEYGYSPQGDGPQNSDPRNPELAQSGYADTFPEKPNQLARRSNNQTVLQNRARGDVAPVRFQEEANMGSPPANAAWADDIDELKQKAQVDKREAQSKRKQIPPFVQKLASFLNDGKNTNLIRWSDDGNSFIVEDEDEFAKNLIPELFKHNNYASFVRQLNMYGFHKKVGLSDNSMRASEKKAKSPSEYSNPYFRRGHSDLLWLIRKTKNTVKKPRPDGEKGEDEYEEFVEEIPTLPQTRGVKASVGQLAIEQGEASLPAEQLAGVHAELKTIRLQQQQIAAMIRKLKNEHEQLYGQAANFQDQHSRHENSINAILTFLATVYNRSLQGPDNAQNIANLFTGGIPQDSNQSHVVDVGDYDFGHLNAPDGQMQRTFKRSPLLLKAAPDDSGRLSTESPSNAGTPYETSSISQNRNAVASPGDTSSMYNWQTQRQQPAQSPGSGNQTQNDFLSVIQDTNARNSSPVTPVQEFSNVLNSLENAGGPALSTSQRADVLRLINNHGSASNPGDNALTSPNPPPMPRNFDRRLAATRSDMDSLAQMQADQDRSVQNLTNLLQPLSPSGSIPGIGDGTEVQPPPLNIDDFLNSQTSYINDFSNDPSFDYFTGADTSANNNDAGLNFASVNDGDEELFANVDTSSNGMGSTGLRQNGNGGYDYLGVDGAQSSDHGKVESVASSEAASPIPPVVRAQNSPRPETSPVTDQQYDRKPRPKRQRLR